jgi:alpha-1,6-mannosyltransferase
VVIVLRCKHPAKTKVATIALGEFLPAVRPLSKVQITKRQRLAIFLLVFSGVVFRSEIAVLLFTQLLALLVESRISLQTIIPAGIGSALVALAISVPIDSYFWQKPIWPELAGFYYNAILGKSAEWGVSPYAHYFSTLLPRLLLNPLILTLLIPTSFMLPSTKYQSRDLVIPSILFIASYSLQPHKESRFIIYVVPPLTAAASLSASYIWTRRSKTLLYRAGSLLLVVSILGSFAASTGMLLISSLNYPGGEALSKLHAIIRKTEWPETPQNSPMNISVHVDVLSCMTGVTRFQEIPWRDLQDDELPIINERRTRIVYDKTEDEEELLVPEFWEKFDYALMEEPGKAIGKWEVVETVYAYAGVELLRPGDGSSFGENMERVYAANNITKEEDGKEKVPGSEDINEVIEGVAELDSAKNHVGELKTKLLLEELGKFGTYKLVRDAVRQVTGGWWIGPRMAPRIRILKKVRGPLPE